VRHSCETFTAGDSYSAMGVAVAVCVWTARCGPAPSSRGPAPTTPLASVRLPLCFLFFSFPHAAPSRARSLVSCCALVADIGFAFVSVSPGGSLAGQPSSLLSFPAPCLTAGLQPPPCSRCRSVSDHGSSSTHGAFSSCRGERAHAVLSACVHAVLSAPREVPPIAILHKKNIAGTAVVSAPPHSLPSFRSSTTWTMWKTQSDA